LYKYLDLDLGDDHRKLHLLLLVLKGFIIIFLLCAARAPVVNSVGRLALVKAFFSVRPHVMLMHPTVEHQIRRFMQCYMSIMYYARAGTINFFQCTGLYQLQAQRTCEGHS